MPVKYKAILFDLLTGLIDSWTLWNQVAGSDEKGRRWRAEYLELTYGCGEYQPYESLVRIAAVRSGLPESLGPALERVWEDLRPWDDVQPVLKQLARKHWLGVVTNCSERLGRLAAQKVGVPFQVVVTSERAGWYKPDARPYRLALTELGLQPKEVLYVAGSVFDLIGTHRVGLDTYWHNRAGLSRSENAPAPIREERSFGKLFDGFG